MLAYNIFIESYPVVVGSDGAGEVAQVGSNVKGLKVGDRVFFQGIIGKTDYCTFQEYCVMPAELVGLTPKSISDEEAAGVSLVSMAVTAAFYHKDGLDFQPHPWQSGGGETGKGKSLVILGGSSSVGQIAIQLAKLSGFSRIVTASSSAHLEHLKTLGADVVLDRRIATAQDYVDAAKEYPLAAVLDSISGLDTGLLGVDILQTAYPNGPPPEVGKSQSTIIQLYHPDPKVGEAAKASGKAPVEIRVVWGIGSSPHLRPTAIELMKALSGEQGYMAKGQIVPNRPLVVEGGITAVDEALEKNKNGISGRKLVIKPQD